ncbi:hypothetical protein GW17_00046471 [Ensete ventricosum]|nr:hypothetical protein GW17_00046471 [Ensete ventricosum]
MAALTVCLTTRPRFTKEIFGSHLPCPAGLPSLSVFSKRISVSASLNQKQREGRRGFLKLLLGNVGLSLPTIAGARKAYADDQGVSSSRMSYSRFLEYLDKDRVKKVDLFENGTIAIVEAVSPELGNRIQRVRVQLPGLSQELLQKLREKNIDFAAHNAQEDSGSLLFNLIGNLAFPLILIGGLFLLSRRSSGGLGGPGGPGFPLAFGQSKAKFQMEPNTGVTFDDVAGVDEAKQDFMEVVEFLKKPERFTAVGARIPKGVLLVGPPGTGKTLLAKAIAGEAGVPFFSISGSEFVEMFVGVGASRVRDLFKKAKENAPCIVFVDEIDAVGRQRGTGIGGGNDEREQTLNQLLTEMDGFEGNTVDVPDVRGRTEILKVHAGNKKFESDVSLDVIAMRTPGFSGADLANLLNEAAILAGRRGHDPVQKVTLIPRGQARGLTWFIPMDDPTLISKQQLFARIVGGLGGRAAEEVIFGESEVTTGAAGDLQQITSLAKQVIQLAEAKLGSGDLSTGQEDAEAELDYFSAHIRLREPDKSEDKAECKATDSRAMGLAAPWYRRGGTSVESSIPCSHKERALVVKGAEEVENTKANSKYQDRVEGKGQGTS